MRGFNFVKHQEPKINLVSHFPAEDTPSRRCYHVCYGIFKKQLATDRVGKTTPFPNDTNPNHFSVRPRGEGEGESGETVNKRWSRSVALEENLDRAGWGGGSKTAQRCMVSMWEQSTYLN